MRDDRPLVGGEVGSPFYDPRSFGRPLFWSNTVSAFVARPQFTWECCQHAAELDPNIRPIYDTNPHAGHAGIELEQVFKTPRGER